MKYLHKYKVLYLVLVVIPSILFAQADLEVEGKVKVGIMDIDNSEDHLVVKQSDGTLASRQANTLNLQSSDTSRSFATDLEITKLLCDCPTVPAFLIESALAIGYTVPNFLEAGFSVEKLLAAGASIPDLVAAGEDPTQFIGSTYQGGLVFYVDANGNGLIAAATDQSTAATWGCNGMIISGADGTAVGTGEQNTIDIDNSCSTAGIAADICINLNLNGFSDWFLPSKDELNLMWLNLADSDGNGTNSGPGDAGNIGNFAATSYWSSSEVTDSTVEFQFFTNGNQVVNAKFLNNYVRAVRSF